MIKRCYNCGKRFRVPEDELHESVPYYFCPVCTKECIEEMEDFDEAWDDCGYCGWE